MCGSRYIWKTYDHVTVVPFITLPITHTLSLCLPYPLLSFSISFFLSLSIYICLYKYIHEGYTIAIMNLVFNFFIPLFPRFLSLFVCCIGLQKLQRPSSPWWVMFLRYPSSFLSFYFCLYLIAHIHSYTPHTCHLLFFCGSPPIHIAATTLYWFSFPRTLLHLIIPAFQILWKNPCLGETQLKRL